MSTFDLSHSQALVTGSSQGIGRAIADGMIRAGARAVYHGHGERPADLPDDRIYCAMDLLAENGASRLAEAVAQPLPDWNCLVCNAGSFFDVSFLDMTLERWERTMDLNVRATYFLIQAFARRLAASGQPGAVVIVASTNGFQSEAESTAYDTSKGALVMLTRTLAHSLAPLHIRVNAIAPGLIRTPLTSGWIDGSAPARAHYERKILLGRIGSPEDCVGPAVFLASSAANYLTGQIITVDGGLTVGQIGRLPNE